MKDIKNKTYLVRMSEAQYNAFIKVAASRDENRSELLRLWIDNYINQYKNCNCEGEI